MDRRAALKKLAAGGAIAAGGSFVLSSTNVAYAASGIGPIPGGATASVSYLGNNKKVRITLNAPAPSCPGGTSTPSYNWGGATGTSSLTVKAKNGATVEITKTNKDAFAAGEFISIPVSVTWTCGNQSAVAQYTVSVTTFGTLWQQ